MSKVLIVDDHPIVRQSYALLLLREPGLECCGEAASGAEAMDKIVQEAPDIVVLDVSLQGEMDGIELLQHLRQNFDQLAVLVVSGHDELVYAEKILGLGAQGYVMKGDASAFVQALRQVADGKTYLSDQVRKRRG